MPTLAAIDSGALLRLTLKLGRLTALVIATSGIIYSESVPTIALRVLLAAFAGNRSTSEDEIN